MTKWLTGCGIILLLILAAWQLGQAGLLAGHAWSAPVLIGQGGIDARDPTRTGHVHAWAESAASSPVTPNPLNTSGTILTSVAAVLQPVTADPALVIIMERGESPADIAEQLALDDKMPPQHEKMQKPRQWKVVRREVMDEDKLYIADQEAGNDVMLMTSQPYDVVFPETPEPQVIWFKPVY